MNFSCIPADSVLGKVVRFPFRLIPPAAVLRIVQGSLRGQKWVVEAGDHGCWLGSYEYRKRRLYEKTLSSGSVVFDIGSHAGFYTLLSSKLTGSHGTVFSFEPLPRNLRFLRMHLALNHITNVRVIEAAVTDRSGISTFVQGRGSYTGRLSQNGEDGLTVRIVSLDDLLERNEVSRPDYMKIDIEGTEFLALQGARRLIDDCSPVIFLATHGRSVHEDCCKLLRSHKYGLTSINGGDADQSSEILAIPAARP